MGERHITFSGHAMRRMFQRGIAKADVVAIIADGETVEVYADDQPYPSRLLSGTVGGRVLHVVVAEDATTRTYHVITAYAPDPDLWELDWRTRRAP